MTLEKITSKAEFFLFFIKDLAQTLNSHYRAASGGYAFTVFVKKGSYTFLCRLQNNRKFELFFDLNELQQNIFLENLDRDKWVITENRPGFQYNKTKTIVIEHILKSCDINEIVIEEDDYAKIKSDFLEIAYISAQLI